MPLLRSLLILPLLLLAASALAAQQATLQEVRVEGSTTYADIVRVWLAARPGTPVDEVDLEAERNRVYALGTFSEVSVAIEERVAGLTLVVRVRENPMVAGVTFAGVETLDTARLRELLEREHLLSPGRVLNTTRAEDAIQTIQAAYRQSGFPFEVPVTLELPPTGEEGTVRVRYVVDETVPIDAIAFEGATVVEESDLRSIFAPLERAGEFAPGAYRAAVEEVDRRYRELGYRLSGVDPAASSLTGGTLTVGIRERRIAGIDTRAIGVDQSELSLQPGDLFNYDTLLQDVRRLARGRTGDVRLVTRATASGDVQVVFELGPPETAGPIERIEIEGNTVVGDDELREVLGLQEGDTFTSTLAQEDFERLRSAYAERGYVILRPDFNYLDGVYVQRIHELRIAGYQVEFEGDQRRTEEFVVTRYLPDPGGVLNENALRRGLQQVARVGAVEPVTATLAATDEPDEVTIVVLVRERPTGVFTPSAQYSTDAGLSASLSYSETNLFGRAHSLSAELSGQSSDVGLMFGGSVRYSIPWLYLDLLDFQEVPTSVSASVFSLVDTNRTLTANGSTRATYPGLADTDANRVLVGEYAQRETGVSLSVARQVLPFTTLRFSGRGSVAAYMLEPPAVECTFDEDGALENAERCSLPGSEAAQYLPQGGLSSFVSATLNYDDRDNPEFPTEGVAGSALVGVGFGNDFRDPDAGGQRSYTYTQVEFGAKTYLRLSDLVPEEITDPNHVLAFRVNFGHQFGGLYPVSKRFQVGRTTAEPTAIRGYQVGDFNLSRTYLTGSVEYRYDFGLSTVATQTVIGIVFADIGYASSVPGFPEYGAPLFAGAGVGVQVNLGFGGVALPALRFDYGFSERHPRGEFRFRVGPVF